MNTAEDIVKNKEFYELTPEERLVVKDIAQNEADFNELKYLLTESASFFGGRTVGASNEMRQHIMEKLYPPTAKPIAWYQPILVFLFPPQKSFYQYPAFQFASILVIFLGIFTLWKSPFETKQFAVNTKGAKQEQKIEKPVPERESDLPQIDNDIESITPVEADFEPLPSPEPVVNRLVENTEELNVELSDLQNNSNGSVIPPPKVDDVLDEELMDANEMYNNSAVVEREIAEDQLATEFDHSIITETNSDKSFTYSPTTQSPTSLSKKESDVSVQSQSISSIESKLSRSKQKQKTMNITEIGNIQSLFFEVERR